MNLFENLKLSLIAPLSEKDYDTNWILLFAAIHLIFWLGAGVLGSILLGRNGADEFNKPFEGFFWGSYVAVFIAIVAALLSFGADLNKRRLLGRLLASLAPTISAVVSAGAFGMVATAIKFDTPQMAMNIQMELTTDLTMDLAMNLPMDLTMNLTDVTTDSYDDADWALTLTYAVLASCASGALLLAAAELNKQLDRKDCGHWWLAEMIALLNMAVFIGLYLAKLQDDGISSKAKDVGVSVLVSAGGVALILLFGTCAHRMENELPYQYWFMFCMHFLIKVTSVLAMVMLVGTFEDIDIAPFSVYGLFFAMAAGSGMNKAGSSKSPEYTAQKTAPF